MLLRYVMLHGVPTTEEDWARFRAWKAAQLAAPQCDMCQPEVDAQHRCEGCSKVDCPIRRRA